MTVQTPPGISSTLGDLRRGLDGDRVGDEMFGLIAELYPICRSITGEGVRQTLRRLRELVPLEIREIPSGTRVFDWTVPKEWNIRDAFIKDSTGERIVEFNQSNLHVVSYSIPVRITLTLAELQSHLFSLPDRPNWVPYRTSYYDETWGFCLTHAQRHALKEGEYEVCIDSSLEPGSLTYGELLLPGRRAEEVLISTHDCHPSLCNDNLSGIAVSTFLASALATATREYSYRFLFIPGTIGSIAWLALNEDRLHLIRHGLVVSGTGDPGPLTYKKSRRGDAEIDRAVTSVLTSSGLPFKVVEFSPYGYDERQYCSPGFNLPVGVLSRTPHGQYAEYHTSADNLDFVKPGALVDAVRTCLSVIEVLEENRVYLNAHPKGEPQLGRRGLYRAIGGAADPGTAQMAMLWVLNLSDGRHSLLDIAERAGMPFGAVREAARILAEHDLLVEPTTIA
jgi:aminopeptidase-like protein